MKYASHLMQWLNTYLYENQIRMDERTKTYFTNIVEPDAFTAYNEMKKLELYVTPPPFNHKDTREFTQGHKGPLTITIDDIKNCTINSKSYTVFDLIDAIGYRKKVDALKMADNLISNEESIMMINTMLANFFFTLWRLNALKRRGISSGELSANYMKEINPYFREKYLTFLNNYDQKQIDNALRQLYLCDTRAKLSMAAEKILVTSLVCGVIPTAHY
jgi:DNA polymerase III delta subunit